MSFLASVTSLDEARLAVAGGADIVDAKNPSAGALGALPLATIRAIRAALPGTALSATIGDPTSDVRATLDAVTATAQTGVDFVKIGLPDGAIGRDTIARVGALSLPPCRLVGVLLADRGVDLTLLQRLALAGFSGVMLDTDDKTGRALPDLLSHEALEAFVVAARTLGIFCGLAGALRLRHVAPLKALGPDVIGFRGALCVGERRTAGLDVDAIANVRRALSADPAAPVLQPPVAQAAIAKASPAGVRTAVERRARERAT